MEKMSGSAKRAALRENPRTMRSFCPSQGDVTASGGGDLRLSTGGAVACRQAASLREGASTDGGEKDSAAARQSAKRRRCFSMAMSRVVKFPALPAKISGARDTRGSQRRSPEPGLCGEADVGVLYTAPVAGVRYVRAAPVCWKTGSLRGRGRKQRR